MAAYFLRYSDCRLLPHFGLNLFFFFLVFLFLSSSVLILFSEAFFHSQALSKQSANGSVFKFTEVALLQQLNIPFLEQFEASLGFFWETLVNGVNGINCGYITHFKMYLHITINLFPDILYQSRQVYQHGIAISGSPHPCMD